jgi:hypothetical protein
MDSTTLHAGFTHGLSLARADRSTELSRRAARAAAREAAVQEAVADRKAARRRQGFRLRWL